MQTVSFVVFSRTRYLENNKHLSYIWSQINYLVKYYEKTTVLISVKVLKVSYSKSGLAWG